MSSLRFCRSCAGPRPRAAIRCPWCLRDYREPQRSPEHLFASPAGEPRASDYLHKHDPEPA